MKEFSAYIDFCANQFNASAKCQVCPYGHCIHDFPDVNGLNCYPCLTKIHKHYNNDKKYQCQRIIYNYVLVHGHRYASEIEKILALLKGCVRFPKELNVFSIGSGPCTELFGVYNQFTDHIVHFKGFDLNPIWEPINQFEQSLFPNEDISFLLQISLIILLRMIVILMCCFLIICCLIWQGMKQLQCVPLLLTE